MSATKAKDLSKVEKTGGLGGSPENEEANPHTSSPVHADRCASV